MSLRQALGDLEVSTRGEGFFDVTRQVASWLQGQGAQNGLLTILCRHTSASLTIQENADPDVLTDLKTALHRFAPQDGRYVHDAEGPDDMPAHIRTMLTSATLSVPVRGGRMHLGTWQGVYLIEHRARPHERRLSLHYLGD